MTEEALTTPTTYDYADIDARVDGIIREAQSYMVERDRENIDHEIRRAYIYARDAHEGQMRKSRDPYILHPVEATRELLILRPDLVTIQSCLLHDVPEDTDRTIADIEREFGGEVAYISAGMEKLSHLKYRGEERTIGSLRKMFIAMSEDLRVIFVKLADRLHNMKTIDHHPNPDKRRRIALETLNIYAPIADRLGIFDFKEALETECFRVLYPDEYARIQSELDSLKNEQQVFVSKVKDSILKILPNNVPLIGISYRIKSPWSIYRKMQRKGYERVRDLYDLFALRITTDSLHHCYDILGAVHTEWTPVPKRFKDYIALPKENGYQSLHTTVVGMFSEFRNQPTEIQIRTLEMHKQAEIGVAAHFSYSETGKSTVAQDIYWAAELKQILTTSQDSEFLQQMKIGVFDDRVFAFTPKGDIKMLPKGATPVDFAYEVHSDLGDHIIVARANGRVVPLDYEIRSGDSMEIVTDINKTPSIAWLSFVKTSKARERIKAYINKLNREELIEKGKFILNSYLEKNFGKSLDKDMSLLRHIDGATLDTKGKEDVLVQLGNLSRKPSSVVKGIFDDKTIELQRIRTAQAEREKKEQRRTQRVQSASVDVAPELIIGGEKGIPYHFGKCCEAKYPDKVVGYINRNGVTIHKVGCESLKNSDFERFIPVYWEGVRLQGLTLRVEFWFENKIGVLKKLSEILFLMNINVESMCAARDEQGFSHVQMTLRSDDEDYYLFERLNDRVKVSISEFHDGRLVDMK